MVKKNNLYFLISFFIFSLALVSLFVYWNITISYKIVVVSVTLLVFSTLLILYKKQAGFLAVYLFYLFLTNYGIFLVNVFVDNPFTEYQGVVSWYYNNFKMILILTSIALISFSFGSLALIFFKKNHKNKKLEIEQSGNLHFFIFGVILIILFTLQYFYYILTGKLSLENYASYISGIEELRFYTIGLALYSIGIAFSFANTNRSNIKYLVILLLPTISTLLISGNRGEVFYPLLSAFGVLIIRNFRINTRIILLLISTFFLIIPLIKNTRNSGILNSESIDIKWFSSIVEIGYTLRPLGYTYEWIKNGENYSFGMSYIAPFQNIVSNFIPLIDRVDYYNVGYGFRYRLPGMGYSVVAESYYNFGVVGIVLVMLLVSFICWKLSNANSFIQLSIFTAIVSILINNVRNAFSFVPAHILIILSVSLIVLFIQKNSKGEKNEEEF